MTANRIGRTLIDPRVHPALARHAAIVCPQLGLKALSPEDEAMFVALYTDRVTMRFIGPALSTPRTRDNFAVALRQWRRRNPRFLYWSIRHTRGAKGTGVVALIFNSGEPEQAEMGIMLGTAARGQGIATIAMGLLARHAFDNGLADILFARIGDRNLAAQRMLERIGFAQATPRDSDAGNGCRWQLVADRLRTQSDD